MNTTGFLYYKKIVSLTSFFLLIVSIIGLAQNTDTPSVRYCFFDSGYYSGTVTSSVHVRNRDLQLISKVHRYGLDANLGLDCKNCLTSRMIPEDSITYRFRHLGLR